MFNQIFSKKVVVPFFQFAGVIAIFTFIVFPGLTAADTILNILSAAMGFFTILAGFYMVTNWFQKYDSIKLDESKPESNKEAKPKRKYTKKAKVTKSEYPLPPHSTTVRTPKVKQKK